MTLARIVSPWTGNGTQGNAFRPQLLDDHPLPAGATCDDVTGQPAANLPPSPNLFTVEAANYPAAWLTAVEADSTYTVLWSQ